VARGEGALDAETDDVGDREVAEYGVVLGAFDEDDDVEEEPDDDDKPFASRFVLPGAKADDDAACLLDADEEDKEEEVDGAEEGGEAAGTEKDTDDTSEEEEGEEEEEEDAGGGVEPEGPGVGVVWHASDLSTSMTWREVEEDEEAEEEETEEMEAVEADRGSEREANMVLHADESEAERSRIMGRDDDEEEELDELSVVGASPREWTGEPAVDGGLGAGVGSGSELERWLLISGLEMESEAFCERAIRLLSFFRPFLSFPFLFSFSPLSAFSFLPLPLFPLEGDDGGPPPLSSFDDDLFLLSIPVCLSSCRRSALLIRDRSLYPSVEGNQLSLLQKRSLTAKTKNLWLWPSGPRFSPNC
jgi:hypothetical protein